LTVLYFTTAISPVSGSSSTSAMWQPLGKADGTSLKTWLTSSLCGKSSSVSGRSRRSEASIMM